MIIQVWVGGKQSTAGVEGPKLAGWLGQTSDPPCNTQPPFTGRNVRPSTRQVIGILNNMYINLMGAKKNDF